MSIAETTLFLIYTIFVFLCNLLGPTFFDVAHVFNFYKFPWSYTSWEDGIVWLTMAPYVILVPYTRKLLDRYEQRRENRIVPVAN